MMKTNKIAVLGISASGKSTFSRQLAAQNNLPLFHMDTLFWKAGWEEVPQDVWRAQEDKIIAQNKWIIEGYICEESIERLRKADVIYYLDVSGSQAFTNGLKRWWKHRRISRPELEGSPEKLDFKMLKVMLLRKERQEIEDVLKDISAKKVIRLQKPKIIMDALSA